MIDRRFAPGRQTGASYVEVLIAALLIIISLAPMTSALRGAGDSADVFADATAQQLRLTAKLEEVLAEPFSVLAAAAGDEDKASSFSDEKGVDDRRIVYLSAYDGDNADSDDDPFTGTDAGLIWIKVEVEGTELQVESLVSK